MSAHVIHIDEMGGNCPVQANGNIDGVPFYFRARGEHWSIEIGPGNTHLVVEAMHTRKDQEEAEAIRQRDCWRYEEEYGSWPEAGWMTQDEARAFIAKGADMWLALSALGEEA